MDERIRFKMNDEMSIHFLKTYKDSWRCVFYYKNYYEGSFILPEGELPTEETAKKYLPNFLEVTILN